MILALQFEPIDPYPFPVRIPELFANGIFVFVFSRNQVCSRTSSIISSSPQRSLGSDTDGERQFNLNGNSFPTVTQALMTMYRRRSPEEFNPKLVGHAMGFILFCFVFS